MFNQENYVPSILKTLIMLDGVVIYFGYQRSEAASKYGTKTSYHV